MKHIKTLFSLVLLTLAVSLQAQSVAEAAAEEEIVAGDSGGAVVSSPNQAQFSSAEGEITAGKGQAVAAAPTVAGTSIHGYVDMGFFFAGNNGVGFVRDFNNTSGLGRRAANFYGDYASTYVNSRHESADQGPTTGFMEDPVSSNGRPTFMLNELFLLFVNDLHEKVRVTAGVNVMPRKESLAGNTDAFELDTAQVDVTPFSGYDITMSAGKFNSIIGIEYRWRKSHERWGITPSLLGRYTDGTPVGAKVRGKHFDKRLIYNIGVTNGSNFIESTHFSEDVDSNSGKTYSSRLSYDFHFWQISLLEVGFSGEYGAQSNQPSDEPIQLVWGPDLQFDIGSLQLRGQFLKLDVEGGGAFNAKNYEGEAWYIEGMYSFPGLLGLDKLGVYGRFGRRDVVELDSRYAFLVDVARITPGLHIAFIPSVVLKVEYLINLEMGKVPELDNNVFTTSLVASF